VAVELSSRADITLDVFERVAWQGETVSVATAALERADLARAAFLRLLERPDVVVYGVTSGYGDRAGVALDAEERGRQARAAAFRSGSFGEALPERVTRGIVLARLANLLDGHAAVSGGLLAAVASLLDGNALPPVPVHGNGGSGEILALAHLFGPLIESHDLGEKEGLALINGSPCAAALVADAVLSARRRLDLAYDVFALSIEAYGAPLDAYDEALGELWGDGHEQRSLSELRARVSDRIVRRPHQAAVAYRILPRVLGQVERALDSAVDVAGISLRAVTDNPVYLLPTDRHRDGRVLSTGGYHNAAAPAALHQLAVSWADLSQLAERHVERLAFVADDGSDAAALAHLFPMVAVGYSEDARAAALPVILPRGGPGANDVASPGFLAWEREQRAGEALDRTMAIVAAAASRFLGGQQLSPKLTAVTAQAGDIAEALGDGRSFGEPLGRLADWFHAVTGPNRT
jgi:histidine ammonia-lyase